MTIFTVHVDFRLHSLPSEEDLNKKIIRPMEELTEMVFVRRSTFKTGDVTTVIMTTTSSEDDDLLFLIRVYEKDEKVLITLLLEASKPLEEIVAVPSGGFLDDVLKARFGDTFEDDCQKSTFYPPLRRCLMDSPYLLTSDDRLLEYNFTEICFSEQSPYQYVQIVDTVDFGKVLILDGLTNLGESDTYEYTHHLMGLPQGFGPKYKDANVLILGGGDGALVKELLELEDPPAFVTMIDIDEMIMEAVNTHMPSVCGPYLRKDNREGPRHRIITGDAIVYMDALIEEGKRYDFIFGDLTDTPVSTSPRDEDLWNFLKTIVGKGIKLLKPETGYYMTHCNGKNVPRSIEAFEKKVLRELNDGKCTFTRTECFVKSFLETWIYYQITTR